MRKKITILAVVLIASVKTQAQTTEPTLYSWAGQFSVSGTHLPEDKVGYWAKIEGQYRQVKKELCICTPTETFTVSALAGIGIPISTFHLKLGGGIELGKDTTAGLVTAGIEHQYFEIAAVANLQQKVSYQFGGTYFPTPNFGFGAGWDTKFSIPLLKLAIRFPISFQKGGCPTCSYDR